MEPVNIDAKRQFLQRRSWQFCFHGVCRPHVVWKQVLLAG